MCAAELRIFVGTLGDGCKTIVDRRRHPAGDTDGRITDGAPSWEDCHDVLLLCTSNLASELDKAFLSRCDVRAFGEWGWGGVGVGVSFSLNVKLALFTVRVFTVRSSRIFTHRGLTKTLFLLSFKPSALPFFPHPCVTPQRRPRAAEAA